MPAQKGVKSSTTAGWQSCSKLLKHGPHRVRTFANDTNSKLLRFHRNQSPRHDGTLRAHQRGPSRKFGAVFYLAHVVSPFESDFSDINRETAFVGDNRPETHCIGGA